MNAVECYRELKERLTQHKLVATATIVGAKGSTPREPGAKMLVTETGSWGTIGGGCGEAEVLAVALNMLSAGKAGERMVRVELTENVTETANRICGGVMEILVEVWNEAPDDIDILTSPGSAGVIRMIPLVDPDPPSGELLDHHSGVSADTEESRKTALEKRRCTRVNTQDGDVFLEFVGSMQTLLICGAGHVAQPLCRLASMLDYRVVILDDRPEFASNERFTEADQVLAKPFAAALDSLDIDRQTLAVLVTRGHRHDEFCLRKLLNTDARYIGMMGSRRRVRAVVDDLKAEGFPANQLERIWAPIGLDIGALTPAELAVSIMAEIVALTHCRSGGHLRSGSTDRGVPSTIKAMTQEAES